MKLTENFFVEIVNFPLKLIIRNKEFSVSFTINLYPIYMSYTQIRSQAASIRPQTQTSVQIRPSISQTTVRAQKALPSTSLPNSVQMTQKTQASSGAQLKQVVTNNNNVNINNNNNSKNNNNNKNSQVSIAVVSSINNSTQVTNKLSTTSPHNKSPSTKSNAISNSHSPTKSPTFNNKTHHDVPPTTKKTQGSAMKVKDKKTSLASIAAATASSNANNANFYPTFGDDDINDVAAMGGVNLAEESQKILGSTEFVGTQIRSCKDEVLLNLPLLQQRIRQKMARHGLDDPSQDVSVLISHATQEYIKNISEKLSVIAEHRMDILKVILDYFLFFII